MRTRLAWLLLLALAPVQVFAGGSPLGLSYVRTDQAEIIYFDSLDFMVPRAYRTFRFSLDWQREHFGWVPSDTVTIFLKDSSDYGNAHVSPAPHTTLTVDVAPESHAFETSFGAERLYSLMNHELVHAVQGDGASSDERFWRAALQGKVATESDYPETIFYNYMTVPRFVAPRWYLEGGAVFMETWMGGGLGRAQGGYDEMVFRAMVRDKAPFYDPLGLVSKGVRADFQVGANAYLYGTRFMTWLAYTYSPEQVVNWFRRDEGSERNYYDQFGKVFGLPLDEAWQHWIEFEHDFQKKNLERVREHPITPYKPLTAASIGSVSRVFFDERSGILYGGVRSPGIIEHVAAINTRDGSERRLADIQRGMLYRVTSLAYDPTSGTIFYTNNNLSRRNLMAVDIKTGAIRTLLSEARIGEVVFNPADKSLMGVMHEHGIATLVRIPYPYDDYSEVHVFPYASVPYDLDISPDGRLLSASVGEPNGDQFVRVWNLDQVIAGDMKPLSEFRFGQSVPESFVFSRDGKYLYGSSYYTGVSNIFRYDVATGEITAVSNADIGFFRPTPLADGRLLVLTYTGDGFVPATIDGQSLEDVSAIKFLGADLAATHPVVTTWQVPDSRGVDYPGAVTEKGPYLPLEQLGLQNAFPVLQGFKNSIGPGYHINIADPIEFAHIGITAAYTPTGDLPEGQRGHFDAKGEYLGWEGELAWNPSDFYDLFGPTKISRKGDLEKLSYEDLLVYEGSRHMSVTYTVSHRDGIDTLPEAQNISTPFSRLTKEQVTWRYADLRRSLGAVDDEKGFSSLIQATEYQADGGSVSQLRGNLDLGTDLPIPHAALWLRTAAGVSNGSSTDPLSDFYFGGFGNNYVDHGTIKRFEDYDSLPGFDIDELGGQRFERVMLEMNLPPVIFEHSGLPGFYANWERTSVFMADLHTSGEETVSPLGNYQSIGLQSDLHFTVMHWSDLTLSLGYGAGLRDWHHPHSEWMFSLKIL